MYSTYKGNGLTIPSFALKHISLGLAYKHPKLLSISDLNEILKQTKFLIEDSSEPLIALKNLLAMYSTLYNDYKQSGDSPMEKNSAEKRRELVNKAEKMLRQFIQKNSYLLEFQHAIEFWCEPGHDLLNIITSEYHLKNSKTDALIDVNDYLDEPPKPSLY